MNKYELYPFLKKADRRSVSGEKLELFYGLNKYDLLQISEGIVLFIIGVLLPSLFLIFAVSRRLLFTDRYRLPFPTLSQTERHIILWTVAVIYVKGAYDYIGL